MESRGVAQLGRALPWGGRGRTFKSCRSDHSYPNKIKAYSDVSLIFFDVWAHFGHTFKKRTTETKNKAMKPWQNQGSMAFLCLLLFFVIDNALPVTFGHRRLKIINNLEWNLSSFLAQLPDAENRVIANRKGWLHP